MSIKLDISEDFNGTVAVDVRRGGLNADHQAWNQASRVGFFSPSPQMDPGTAIVRYEQRKDSGAWEGKVGLFASRRQSDRIGIEHFASNGNLRMPALMGFKAMSGGNSYTYRNVTVHWIYQWDHFKPTLQSGSRQAEFEALATTIIDSAPTSYYTLKLVPAVNLNPSDYKDYQLKKGTTSITQGRVWASTHVLGAASVYELTRKSDVTALMVRLSKGEMTAYNAPANHFDTALHWSGTLSSV